ncbi:MAG: hypothetical protein IPK87_00520 [Planctomycetes bacterium]|nr:hypothetical protein [Planctomycetota bacterium]
MERTPASASRKSARAQQLLEEIREMLNDIAQSATILGATPFAGRQAAAHLGASLHTTLLEFEIALAEVQFHNFEVPR